MIVLIDTSVWIDHFRNGNAALVALLGLDRALTHPMVRLEIACGTPPAPRIQTLNNMGLLQPCNQASLGEVMEFIEHEKLHGLGCGLVDMALLASTLITPGAELWTLDKRLANLAGRFGVAHLPTLH
ncbi:MAG: type II toxin-antitoxin system VapC family toxin [Polaromonas sp.]|nr:type II toxin-antitoxin system VapC family toxin [Polaromonas sp.]